MKIDIPERLHNCPNCGGALQDDGRCRFCGSKVYDFLNLNLDNHSSTYIRMKYGGRIIHFKIIPTESRIGMDCHRDSVLYADSKEAMYTYTTTYTGSLDFIIDGDIIVEDKDGN